jgi:TIR domain
MSKIFISYRRDDSSGYAQTIYRELVQHVSKDQVFMDVATMEPGVDFVRVIEEAVGKCDVLLALIGKRWANVGSAPTSSLPTARRDDPEDFVRLEISTALARDIRVIPVLVDGMTMPSEETLPDSLKPLSRRNAIEISNTRFNYDVEQLITAVRKILDATEAKRKAEQERERNSVQQIAPAPPRPKRRHPRRAKKKKK